MKITRLILLLATLFFCAVVITGFGATPSFKSGHTTNTGEKSYSGGDTDVVKESEGTVGNGDRDDGGGNGGGNGGGDGGGDGGGN